jgi:hypothetical protein
MLSKFLIIRDPLGPHYLVKSRLYCKNYEASLILVPMWLLQLIKINTSKIQFPQLFY